MTRVSRPRPQEPRAEPRSLLHLARWAAVVWFALVVLYSLTTITDPDLGFHIAWGRILLRDFAGARTVLLGQDPSVAVYAYSYWLYQLAVVALFDHLGPWGLVLFRAAMLWATFALAYCLAGRLGASPWARALAVAFGALATHERFVDRPDVFSMLACVAALWILVLHRRDRGVWLLVPLMAVWVNTHHYFSLLFPLFGVFALADALEGRRDWGRHATLLGCLILATFLNPIGPGVWAAQLKLPGALSGSVAPIAVEELASPYAPYNPTLAMWTFRIGMPICLLLAFLGRRRIGRGALLGLAGTAAPAALVRRAVPWFAVTAVALAPLALDDAVAALRARAARVVRLGSAALALLVGLAGVTVLANGRFFMWQDKDFAIRRDAFPGFPATAAARFLRTWNVEGPILHDPISAGAILMENGTRLTPFLDPRWCGTEEANRGFRALSFATDRDVGAEWDALQRSRGFETVMLNFYGMPALLRHIAADPRWPLVYHDDAIAVFCRRGGRNARAIAVLEPQVAATWAWPDTAREADLARQVLRFLRSPKPSPLARLAFPLRSFRLANFALQIRDRPNAQAAYLDLFRREGGSLHVSPHRADVLGNTLWCLGASTQWEARAALCAALLNDPATAPERRRELQLELERVTGHITPALPADAR